MYGSRTWKRCYKFQSTLSFCSPFSFKNIRHASLSAVRTKHITATQLLIKRRTVRYCTIRNGVQNLIEKPEGKRPLRKPKGNRKDNNKTELRQTGRETEELINFPYGRSQWGGAVRMCNCVF